MDEPLKPHEALSKAAEVFNNLGDALNKALEALSKLGSTNRQKKIYPPDETEHKYIYGGRKKKKK